MRRQFKIKTMVRAACLVAALFLGNIAAAEDSLPLLKDGNAPTNLAELWGAYDPRAEPLDAQVVREWEEHGITLRQVVFTIGVFKGKPARLAGFYGFVKRGERVPGILQVHGGGQSASLDEVRDFARNGYACLSINWGGNRMEGAKDDDPNTDWGALDATQRHNDHYSGGKPDAKTLDEVESPRNNNWFLLVLAARRGLTFLEHQPEVDPERLGVTGHSMGGKITVNVAGIDRRVKAAVPSCGGAGDRSGKLSGMPGAAVGAERPSVYDATIDDSAYIPGITCPIIFISPTNDFAGPFDNMTENWQRIGSQAVASTIAPHLNHRAIPETSICGVLWFDQHLKGSFRFPTTPELTVSLETAGGVPRATLKPDRPSEVVKVDLYYSTDPHCLTRFWRDAEAKRDGDAWVADLPVLSTEQPLFVYANVSYPLTTERLGFRGSKPPAAFMISSREAILLPEELQKAGTKATDTPSRLIDDFGRGWHDWFRLEWGNPHHWTATTRKLKDPKWRGPDGAKLVFDVRCPADNVLKVTVISNGWGAFLGKPWGGTYEARTPIKGSPDWQTVSVSLDDLVSTKQDDPSTLASWASATELSFGWARSYLLDGKEVSFGSDNQQLNGWREPREFKNLRWEGGTDAATSSAVPASTVAPADAAAVPQSVEELWADFDPRRDPLETEVIREWREDGGVFRHVRFLVGTFKRKPSRMAAIYGFPEKTDGKVPGVMHIHGGGQRGSLDEVKFLVGRGYAALSLNWGGRGGSDGPFNAVQGAEPGDPNTDWGAVDPSQCNVQGYSTLLPGPLQFFDDLEQPLKSHPKNNNWYLLTLGCRRGLTFLEAQPEVDPERLGVHGYSMGGNLTMYVAGTDDRLKAAVPAVGGQGWRWEPHVFSSGPVPPQDGVQGDVEVFRRTLSFESYAPRICCPVLHRSATNDFHGWMDDVYRTNALIKGQPLRYSWTPHMNHRLAPEVDVAMPLWLDYFLKDGPALPETPRAHLEVATDDGTPRLTVRPDVRWPVEKCEIYYSVDSDPRARFWRSAEAAREGDAYTAWLPLESTSRPLFAFANVFHAIPDPVSMKALPGSGDLVRQLCLSSELRSAAPAALAAAGVREQPLAGRSDNPSGSLLIDDFSAGWRDWYRLNVGNRVHWQNWTRKVTDPAWRGPDGAALAITLTMPKTNRITVVVVENEWRSERGQKRTFTCTREIQGNAEPQTITFSPADFASTDEKLGALESWASVDVLGLCGFHSDERPQRTPVWDGPLPDFHRVEWR